jgi:hypothetical protein
MLVIKSVFRKFKPVDGFLDNVFEYFLAVHCGTYRHPSLIVDKHQLFSKWKYIGSVWFAKDKYRIEWQ